MLKNFQMRDVVRCVCEAYRAYDERAHRARNKAVGDFGVLLDLLGDSLEDIRAILGKCREDLPIERNLFLLEDSEEFAV